MTGWIIGTLSALVAVLTVLSLCLWFALDREQVASAKALAASIAAESNAGRLRRANRDQAARLLDAHGDIAVLESRLAPRPAARVLRIVP